MRKLLNVLRQNWEKLARRFGVFQSRIILTLFYFIILAPFGIFFTLFKDKLEIKTRRKSSWILKSKQSETLEEMKKQY